MPTDATDRLSLPLLAAGQAQKELFHNEGLAALDLAVQASVVAVGGNDPPAAPAPGQCWIVGAAPTGAWAGRAQALAGWTQGGWRFVAPTPGLAAWDAASGQVARFAGGAWSVGTVSAARLEIGGVPVVGARQPAVAPPAGGTVVDAEARAALAAILAALVSHGLIGR